jgi:GNAT superfamily N-acetyltransferase
MGISDSARLEAIESQALQSWFESVSASPNCKWSLESIGDAQCFVSSNEPSILVNRVLGLGSASQPTEDQLTRIRKIYEDAGVSRFFLHVIPDRLGPNYEQVLQSAGYERYRGWMKFSRGAGDIAPITTGLSLRQIGPEHAPDFAALVRNAFDFDNSFDAAIAAVVDAPNWRVYMSFDGDVPAGTGALYMRDGVAYLDFGATHPDFRRRGAQSGILSLRIRTALEAGCTAIVTMTGEAVPGDEQHSYRNIQKAGFEESYLRENWIPAES